MENVAFHLAYKYINNNNINNFIIQSIIFLIFSSWRAISMVGESGCQV